MLDETQRQNFINLGHVIRGLIQERSPELSITDTKKEAARLSLCLVEIDRRRRAAQDIDLLKDDPDPYDQLSNIKYHIDAALKESQRLGVFSTLLLNMHSLDNEYEILSPEDRLITRLSEAADLIDPVVANLKPTRGRPKQIGKNEYIEAIIQIYKKASGIVLDNTSGQEKKLAKSKFRKLLTAARFDQSFTQSAGAFSKAADRYLETEREHKDDVSETLKDMLS